MVSAAMGHRQDMLYYSTIAIANDNIQVPFEAYKSHSRHFLKRQSMPYGDKIDCKLTVLASIRQT